MALREYLQDANNLMALQRSARKPPAPDQALLPAKGVPAEAPLALSAQHAKDPADAADAPEPHALPQRVEECAHERMPSPACAAAAPPAAAPEPIQLVLRIGRLTPPPDQVLLLL